MAAAVTLMLEATSPILLANEEVTLAESDRTSFVRLYAWASAPVRTTDATADRPVRAEETTASVMESSAIEVASWSAREVVLDEAVVLDEELERTLSTVSDTDPLRASGTAADEPFACLSAGLWVSCRRETACEQVQTPPLLPHAVPAATLHRWSRDAVSVELTDTTKVLTSVVVTVTVDDASTSSTRVLYVDVATSAALRVSLVIAIVTVVSMAFGVYGGGETGGGEGGATRM